MAVPMQWYQMETSGKFSRVNYGRRIDNSGYASLRNILLTTQVKIEHCYNYMQKHVLTHAHLNMIDARNFAEVTFN